MLLLLARVAPADFGRDGAGAFALCTGIWLIFIGTVVYGVCALRGLLLLVALVAEVLLGLL